MTSLTARQSLGITGAQIIGDKDRDVPVGGPKESASALDHARISAPGEITNSSAPSPRQTDMPAGPIPPTQPAGTLSNSSGLTSSQALTDMAGAAAPPPATAPVANNQFSHPWTEAEKAMVRKFAALGLSSGEIAAKFEERTRSSVCGLALRMGIKLKGTNNGNSNHKGSRKSVSIADQRRKNVRGGKPKKVAKPAHKPTAVVVVDNGDKDRGSFPVGGPADAPEPRKIALLDLLVRDCRWPVEGEKEHTLFCGHDRAVGSYCKYHAGLVYAPLPIRRKAAA
jgi:hypothetical protein